MAPNLMALSFADRNNRPHTKKLRDIVSVIIEKTTDSCFQNRPFQFRILFPIKLSARTTRTIASFHANENSKMHTV